MESLRKSRGTRPRSFSSRSAIAISGYGEAPRERNGAWKLQLSGDSLAAIRRDAGKPRMQQRRRINAIEAIREINADSE